MTEPTTTPEAMTPAERMELLRGILGDGHSIKNGSSGEAQTPSPRILSSRPGPGDDGAPDAAVTRHILVVDDDDLVRQITSRILSNARYGVLEASSAREALRLLESRDSPVDLVLTDVVMPETDGRVLGRLIAELYPRLPVAYMSAHSINDLFHRGSPGPNLPFLSKPFSPQMLLDMVKAVLASQLSGALEPPENRHTGNRQRPHA